MKWLWGETARRIGQTASLYDERYRLKEEFTVTHTARNEICQHGHIIARGSLAVRHFSWHPCWQKWYCLNHETLPIRIEK